SEGDHIESWIKILGVLSAADKDHVMIQSQLLHLSLESLAQCTFTDYYEAYCVLGPVTHLVLFKASDRVEKHSVMLNFSQSADYSDQGGPISNTQLSAKSLPATMAIRKGFEIKTQGNYFELLSPADVKRIANLQLLLAAHNDDPVCHESGQALLDRDEESRLGSGAISLEKGSTIGVHKLTLSGTSNQGSGSQPAVREASKAPDGSRLRRMCVHDVRSLL